MKLLPHWCLTDKRPAFFDTESATVIEQTAKVYGAMNELINEYNLFVDGVNQAIEVHQKDVDANIECFKEKIIKICNEYTDSIDMKINCQDRKIQEAINFMKTNLSESISQLVVEMKDMGELDAIILNAINNMEANFTNLETHVNSLITELETRLNSKINTNSNEIEILKTDNEANKTNISSLSDGLGALESEFTNHRNEWSDTKREITEIGTTKDLTSELTSINSKIKTNGVKLLRNNNGYYLSGTITTTNEATFTSSDVLFKIPAKYCPPHHIYYSIQANNNSVCTASLNCENGEVKISSNLTNSAWISFNMMWIK